jgi:hypothetical protein
MADYVLENTRKAGTMGINLPLGSKAESFKFVRSAIGNGKVNSILRPQFQLSGSEGQTFIQSLAPITANYQAFQSTGQQDGGILVAQWQLKAQPLLVRSMAIELFFNWPADATPTYQAFNPIQLWCDRVEFSFEGNYPLQRLYMDMSFFYICSTLNKDKIKNFSAYNGHWWNPINAPDNTARNPGTLSYNSGTTTITLTQANHLNSLCSGGGIYPFQPFTSAANSPDLRGQGYVARIPLVGSWIQQAGIIDLTWIQGGTLYINLYGAGRPHYNTPPSGSKDTEITITQINLLCECLSVPMDANVRNIRDAYLAGLFILYMDYVRSANLQPAPNLSYTAGADPFGSGTNGPAVSTYSSLLLDTVSGRRVSHILIYGRNKGAFLANSSSGWLISNSNQGYSRTRATAIDTTTAVTTATSTVEPIPDPAKCAYMGMHTVWGDMYPRAGASQVAYPALDILDQAGLKLFSSDSMTMERWRNLIADPQLENSVFGFGRIGGMNSFSPFFSNVIPIFAMGNPMKAASGIYDGGLEFPLAYKFQFQFGNNADACDSYDIYYACWKMLTIQNTGLKLLQLDDPRKSENAITLGVRPAHETIPANDGFLGVKKV